MQSKSDHLNLSENSPVLAVLPPFLLKEIPDGQFRETNYHFEEFRNSEELMRKFPKAHVRKGHPHEIFRFLASSEQLFLEFGDLGSVAINHNASGNQVKKDRMSLWLDYALSPELWGTEGKWTRFHEELHKLFEEKNLLQGPAVPGYYPLKSDARSWEKLPISGDLSETCLTLVLPWTFSLTDLRRLKSFVNEEK